jgi:hypothetical protein
VLWFRTGFVWDPDPGSQTNADLDPDPGSQTNADPDTCQILPIALNFYKNNMLYVDNWS